MKIQNIKSGSPKVSIGACTSVKALVRYMKLEGWIEGTCFCTKCEFMHPVLAHPDLLTRRQSNTVWMEMKCKCGADGLIFKEKVES